MGENYFFVESIVHQRTDYLWNDFLSIYWQISGEAIITSTYTENKLLLDQLCFIPFNEMYRINAETGQGILFKFDVRALSKQFDLHIPTAYFDPLKMHEEEVKNLKIILTEFLQTFASKTKDKSLALFSVSFKLFYELSHHFSIKEEDPPPLQDKEERIEAIKTYIYKTSTKDESIKEISDTFYMSASHFSKYFKEKTGMSPSDYRNRIRLEKARGALESTNKKVEEISEKVGFKDINAFIRAFKKEYGITPGSYRTQLADLSSGNFYETLNQSQLVHEKVIEKYIHPTTLRNPVTSSESIFLDEVKISLNQTGKEMPKSLNRILFVNSATILNRPDTREMLRHAQEEIGYDYIAFHGLFDDTIPIYIEGNRNKQPHLLYSYVDELMDFIVSLGLKPIIEFSYLPKNLMKSDLTLDDIRNPDYGVPKSMALWDFLIQSLVQHFIQRYEREKVSHWLFCGWPFPDLDIDHNGSTRNKNFYDLYLHTYTVIKSIDPALQFGIPNMIDVEIEDGTWFNHFIDFCKVHKCLPDFYGYYFMATDKESLKRYLRHYQIPILSTDSEAMNHSIQKVLSLTKKMNITIKDLYIPVMDFCYAINPLEDTIFKACYLVKNALENMFLVKGLGCTQLTDMTLNVTMSNKSFQGLSGLYTKEGIPKASFYACQFLSELDGRIIGQGNGWIALKRGDLIRILLYNYEHFTTEYAQLEVTGVDQRDRYLPFDMSTSKRRVITLLDVPYESYQRKDLYINRENGSSYDQWVILGEISNMDNALKNYLKKKSIPGLSYKIYKTENSALTLRVKLEPLEVRLIELRPMSK